MDNLNFGSRLRQRRLELHKTLEEVGSAVGLTRATIQRYESGAITNIPRKTIEKIAKVLKVTPGYLTGWDVWSDSPYDEVVAYISDVFGEIGLEVKLVNEEDPDWIILFDSSFYGSSYLDDLYDLAEEYEGCDAEEKYSAVSHLFQKKSAVQPIYRDENFTIYSDTRKLPSGAEPFLKKNLLSMTEPITPSRTEILDWLAEHVRTAAYGGGNYEDLSDEDLLAFYLDIRKEFEDD